MHTIKSEFLGYNSYGHPEFDTTYTELGGLLKKAKYRESQNALDTLAETAASFIQTRDWDIDCIVPVPPSNMTRKHQPVFENGEKSSVYFSPKKLIITPGSLRDVTHLLKYCDRTSLDYFEKSLHLNDRLHSDHGQLSLV